MRLLDRFFRRILCLPLLLGPLITPLGAMADEAHTWCVPGDAKDPSGSSDPTVNQIVQWVCSQEGFASCCDRSPPVHNKRWTASCIHLGSTTWLGARCWRIWRAQT